MRRNLDQVPTSAISFVETEHGRLRRQQRGIDKKDLQAAKKYGSTRSTHPRPNGDPTSIYTYKDIVYITNDITGEEVTSYSVPLELEYVPINDALQREHDQALRTIRSDMNSWLSNTVLVVDRSGSMRCGDVWGTRSRLDAVWVAVALDFLAHRLETGELCSQDVISVVSFSDHVEVLIHEQPASWILYNRILHIYKEKSFPARGHGPYIPSLLVAEDLLTRNSNTKCALAICFLSDGRPSDLMGTKAFSREEMNARITEVVGDLAKKFGRRLTFATIGIGNSHDFDTLRAMVDIASDFGAVGIFRLPSLTCSSIGDAFSSVATSVTTTKSEMTDVATLQQQCVRNVLRESRKKASEEISFVCSDQFWIYKLDNVRRFVYEESFHDGRRNKALVAASLQHCGAKFVAMHKEAFGEGAERFAYRFFELARDGRTIVGAPLVAKESRLILEEGMGENSRKKFAMQFCEAQQIARSLAAKFNKKMSTRRRIDRATPQVTFLDCSVYQLNDNNLGILSVLVEERLDYHKWHKWNMNNGYVEGMKASPTFSNEAMRDAMANLNSSDLNDIEEGSEDEDEEDDERNVEHPIVFTPSEVAQAFSHFTYFVTGRKRLVCDLQGIFDEKENILKFSDPVIHYYNHRREDRRFVHGRTDRGRKGCAMFFATHHDHCGHLCRLMIGRFRRDHRGKHDLK